MKQLPLLLLALVISVLLGNAPTLSAATASPHLTAPQDMAIEDETWDWIALGTGSAAILSYGLTLLGATWFALPAVILGVGAIGLGWWLRRKKGRKNWRTLLPILCGSLITAVFLTAWGLVLFF